MRTLVLGYAKGLLTMFIKKKKNRSGTTSIVVAEKTKGSYKELVTIGVAKDANDIDSLVNAGREWISKEESRRYPQLDLYGEEREACDREREEVRRVLSNISNILLNGCDLILDRTFDRIGFNRIDDDVFRKLVKARLAYPTSKAATVEYLKNHFDEDVDLSKIYRYLDKLSDHQHEIVQDISVRHTAKLFGGNIGVIVVEKIGGKMKELATIGVAYSEDEVENLVNEAKEWISKEGSRRHPQLDLYGEEREACDREREEVRRVLSNVSNILLNGCDLILDRTFDRIGFNRIDDDVFRKLVKARLAYPTSKAATVEYLKNHFDEDVDLSKIYRYLDKLSDHQHEIVQDISVRHTAKLFGGNIGVLFYDVTTLYFEADYEDELRKTGFSKEGRHSNPQIILGLLVSLGGYPLAYCIHEGNKYEGHTMLPTINEFVSKYGLENFVVVADSGLMNNANIAELEAHGYKYIIGAKIKNESQEVKNWILEQPKRDCQMVEYDKGGGRRLLVGYTDDRAKKDAYNREKGIRRLEKAYKHGALTKGNINKRGYNKFLSMDGEVKVAINYDRIADDSKWDGLKGYLTNTDIPIQDVYTAYHNLWHVERAFRIAKSKIEIRPMFHFTRKRIEAHICICFVALKVYKELERMLKVSEIKMSVDKVLALAKTITTIQIKLPLNKEVYTQTMLMARHQKIAKLFDEDFWVTR